MKISRNIRASMANDRGSAFIITLLVFFVVLVLGVGILGASTANMWMGEADRDYHAAYYIAESGRDKEVAHIQEVIAQQGGDSDDADAFFTAVEQYFQAQYPLTIDVFDSQFGDIPQAVVSIENIGERPAGADSYTYTLVSLGDVGTAKRQIVSQLQVTWMESQSDAFNPDVALFTLEDFSLSGSSRIIGPAGTNTTGEGDIGFGWSTTVSGDLYISPDADPYTLIDTPRSDLSNVGGDILYMPEPRVYELPPYPAIPSLPVRDDIELAWDYQNITIDQDGYYHEISTNSYTLNIDVGNGVRRLVVDDFLIKGDGHVNIVGDGLLELYVTNLFSLTGSSTFNLGGDNDNVMLYYSGDTKFAVDGATAFAGSVYVQSADVDIVGSGGVKGHIVTGGTSVDITGNAAAHVRVIYAPNAFVRLTGSGHVTGAVIAKRCILVGDTYITYQADAGAGGIPIDGFGTEAEVEINVTKATERDF